MSEALTRYDKTTGISDKQEYSCLSEIPVVQ